MSSPLHYSERVIDQEQVNPPAPKPKTLYTIASSTWKIRATYKGRVLRGESSWITEKAGIECAKEIVKDYNAEPPLVIEVMKVTHTHKARKVLVDFCGEQREEYEQEGYPKLIRCEVVWDSVGNYPRDIRERCPKCNAHPSDVDPGPPFHCPECGNTWGEK